jgi:hypothetical protein
MEVARERVQDVAKVCKRGGGVTMNGSCDRARVLPLEKSEQCFRPADIAS